MGFLYSKEVDAERLTEEISSSEDILVAIDYINILGSTGLEIFFKGELSQTEKDILDLIISEHVNKPLPEFTSTLVSFNRETSEDSIPYVYQTTRPMGYSTYFTGSSDDMTESNIQLGKGRGNKLLFCMLATDASKSIDIQFNEDVYIKDGMIHCVMAPFGATIDIDIYHPAYGVIDTFGRGIPILKDGWFPMDTDDRSFFPKGLILKITVYNSNGVDENSDEDIPTGFKVSGRFELFRKNANI